MREAVHLRAAVVFVENRPPPLEHAPLDFLRARCGGVNGHLVRRKVEAGAVLRRQFQHAREHRRHPLAVGDGIVVNGLQRHDGVEAAHHHHRAAERLHGLAEADGRGVVKRRRRKVDGVLVHAPKGLLQAADGAVGVRYRAFGKRSNDAFRAARGAGTVEHEAAGRFFGQRRCGLAG